jgi:hypothetical protein
VDDSDPEWIARKEQVTGRSSQKNLRDMGKFRFRDWGILKYWFRSVEENAPWVRKIHFITCGQVPEFLNLNHPKLHFVTHKEYIPEEYLPTFSSRTIDLNFHRIENLTEHFVYFNDDMYLNRPVKKTDFFQNGKPCYSLIEKPLRPDRVPKLYDYTQFNNMAVINHCFSRRDLLRTDFFKLINRKYGTMGAANLFFLPLKHYMGFYDPHVAVPVLKSTMKEVWEREYDRLHDASSHKAREMTDINQYIFRYWDLARGNFTPCANKGKLYNISSENLHACVDDILLGRHSLICINDSQMCDAFEKIRTQVAQALEQRYPNPCSFEKQESKRLGVKDES